MAGTEQYERVSKALALIAEREGMAMAVLHYYDPTKDAMNPVIFTTGYARPLATAVVAGVDVVADELNIVIECECGCEDGDPVNRSADELLDDLDDDGEGHAA